MGPDSDESFNRETLEGFQTFVDPKDPVSHFTRTVYVMRLHIHCSEELKTKLKFLKKLKLCDYYSIYYQN